MYKLDFWNRLFVSSICPSTIPSFKYALKTYLLNIYENDKGSSNKSLRISGDELYQIINKMI